MKWLGVKSVPLKALHLPGDFQARLKAPHVALRAKSIKEVGVIALPVVEWKTKRLVAGGDRVAALTLNGADVIEVRAVEGTEAELRRVMLAENIERRPSERAQLIAEYVGEVEAELKAEGGLGPSVPKPQGGRPPTPRAEAQRRVAADLGVSPAAVKQADRRLQEKAAKAEEAPKKLYEAWGLRFDESLAASIVGLIEPLDTADQVLRGVQSSLTRALEMAPAEWHTPRSRLERLRGQAKVLAQEVRAMRPRALCAYCKGLPKLRAKCAGCLGLGWLDGEKMEGVPEELRLRGDDAMVAVDGRTVRLADVVKRR